LKFLCRGAGRAASLTRASLATLATRATRSRFLAHRRFAGFRGHPTRFVVLMPSSSRPDVQPSAGSSARLVLLALVVIGVISLLVSAVPTASAQDTIADARREKKELEEQKLLAQTELEVAEAEFSEVEDALRAATELVERQQSEVDAAEIELAAAELNLRQIEVAIEWAIHDVEELSDAVQELAIEAYIGERDEESATLLHADDVRDGVTRLALIELATNSSDDVIDLVRQIRDRQELLEVDAAAKIEEVRLLQAGLKEKLAALEENEARQAELHDAVEARRDEWRDRIDDIDDEQDDLEKFIKNRQAVQQGQAPNIEDLSSDGYIWPTAGGVGSGFGPRFHPILRYNRPHTGLDIGGAQGAPIYAAKGGTVIAAGVRGGYGNTIVIDHGDGLSSLYAHQSKYEVSNGARVETGEIIGRVGSTGMSTGPHLHFEMRLFGTPIDPMPFMPPR